MAELAILMLVLVPVFLYTLFLNDLLRHQLMGQAAVVSTPWDWHALNYERFDRSRHVDTRAIAKAQVQSRQTQTAGARSGNAPAVYARLMWCDHTAAYNSYDPSFDCNDPGHHQAVAAHACWDTELAQEVACGVDADTGAGYTDVLGLIDGLKDSTHKGGEIYCSARVGVLNYMLIQRMFGQFSSVDTTRATKLSGSVHGHRGAAAANTYPLTMETFSVVHDPWAMATVENVNPDGRNLLQRRVNSIYWTTMGQVAYAASLLYLARAIQAQVIGPQALIPADTLISDNLMEANVAFRTGSGNAMRIDNHYPSPWLDWNNNPVQASFNARGTFYMGTRSFP